ncbi:hypothetical protein JAAARDRAFT_173016 [Jaapia argillacea MUCL 33604]|uniref:Phorbol-ester/DAG-type domain-containing protein n=1 Tax=Jaapia argillacea MUCL 33604 TaxID=933084 RepID=A0A067QDX4_9AGAM|nr:hypothetical protein JAAARDRAFT_173016 [Jaapia argillacea MUCL 33604]
MPELPFPRLRIDTSGLTNSGDFDITPNATPSPTHERTFNGVYSGINTPHLPLSPNNSAFGPPPRSGGGQSAKERDGLLGLLTVSLKNLQKRPAAPSVFDGFKYETHAAMDQRLGAVLQTVKGVVRLQGNAKRDGGSHQAPTDDLSDDENENSDGFSTHSTFELMTRLRGCLMEFVIRGYRLLEISSSVSEEKYSSRSSSSPNNSKRHSIRVIGRRSRSRSPSGRGSSFSARELLSQCIEALSSVVSEDCRFQPPSFGPARPPNALHAVTLDVGQILATMCRSDPKLLSHLGFALIPAFNTFKAQMHGRLLALFEEGIMRGMLQDLRQHQGFGVPVPSDDLDQNPLSIGLPVVSIQVEEAQDDADKNIPRHGHNRWVSWSSSGPTHLTNVPSSTASSQSPSIYYLSSLVAPLLAAAGENVDITSPDIATVYRFFHLFDTIVDLKGDACADVLEVVAYHTSKARRCAISLISSFWPKSLGHVVITKAFPVLTYTEALIRLDDTRAKAARPSTHHPYAHQFVPWRFTPQSSISIFESHALHYCRVCSTTIRGFGLLCPFCICAVHFDCYDYPDGSSLSQYTLPSDSHKQKVAVHRFCHILPAKRNTEMGTVKKASHTFRLVNLFTLSLCFICRKALWGCVAQGFRCTACKHFAHSSCLSSAIATTLPRCRSIVIDSSHMTIEWSVLRQSFQDHYGDLFSSRDDLSRATYEEVSILHCVLWVQLQIMNNGLALGSIVVTEQGDGPVATSMSENQMKEFEIHSMVRLYEDALHAETLPVSPCLDEYLIANRHQPSAYSIFFDWAGLMYVSSILKSPVDIRDPLSSTSSDLLNVALPVFQESEASPAAFQVVSLAHMRDVLGNSFHVFSDAAARHLLSYVHHLGFFDAADLRQELFTEPSPNGSLECIFTLPVGLDEGAHLETLFSSIEVCLSDLDVSINEIGFLLLVRRLWPCSMMSDYAIRRICRAVLLWIFAEDESLASVLRDCVAQGRPVPGIRSGVEAQPWPSSSTARPTPASVHNGGDYVACRRVLLHQYAGRWLLALHDMDIDCYASLLFEVCVEISENDIKHDDLLFPTNHVGAASNDLDKTLRLIMKLGQASVTYSSLDDLIHIWLESIPNVENKPERVTSLQKLFNRDPEGIQRYSSMIDVSVASTDVLANLDVWTIFLDFTSQRDSCIRAVSWMHCFASSGVDIPVPVYLQLSTLARQFDMSLEDWSTLILSTMLSTWLKSLGRQQLQGVIVSGHALLASHIIKCLHSRSELPAICTFIRRSLATCLLLFGCERGTLLTLGMVTDDEIDGLPSRRKLTARASMLSDPIIVDSNLITMLRHYVDVGVDEISVLVAKFLHLLVTDAPLLEPHEVDNFILRNESALCACAWQFYEVQFHEIANIRIAFLLRILVVDSQPLQTLMRELFGGNTGWELRFQAVTRLFRMILDVTSPAFLVEDRQFRSAFIDVFTYYFKALWSDEREEIRLAVDTWSQTLLPSHLQAISLCWDEAVAKLPIPQRVNLVAFLIQLRPHFPGWKMLSWESIIEILLEDDYLQKNGNNEDGPAAAHLSMYGLSSRESVALEKALDPDMALLRASIVLLSLQMMADGVEVDVFSLLKIKVHLVQLLGFSDVSVVPSPSGLSFYVQFGELSGIPELAFPCVNELLATLDAFHPFNLAPSAMGGPYAADDTTTPLLIGGIFVDVMLSLISETEDLVSLPFVTAKTMLEAVLVIIYKHDFETKPLKHLSGELRKAVRRVMTTLLQDISYELRQLALSICQAYIKRWHMVSGLFMCDSIETAAQLIISLDHNGEDTLVTQATQFIESTLTMFSFGGLLNNLCKRHLQRDFFVVIRNITQAIAKCSPSEETLRDALLRDTFSRAQENDRQHFHIVVQNLYTFVEVVHHQHYSLELIQHVSHCISIITRRMAELPESFDPAPLLLLIVTLIEHNRAHSRDLIRPLDNALRVALTRFHVTTSTLLRLLEVTSNLYRRAQAQSVTITSASSNLTVVTTLEVLSDGLRRRARVTSSTIASLLEVVISTDSTANPDMKNIFTSSLLNLTDDCLSYLQTYIPSEGYSEADFHASQMAANLILTGAKNDPQIFSRLSPDAQTEKYVRSTLSVRAWNMIVLSALRESSLMSVSAVLEHFSTFLAIYYASLRGFTTNISNLSESAAPDINHAYAAIKLWMLLVRKRHQNTMKLAGEAKGQEDATTRMVWNDLWPPFETIVAAFEGDAQGGSIQPLGLLTWTSVADLFLFVRQLGSVAGLETAPQIFLLHRLRLLGRSEALTSKIGRAVNTLSEPPEIIPLDVLVAQTVHDMIAAEKLQALEAQREGGKPPLERYRKEVRIVS